MCNSKYFLSKKNMDLWLAMLTAVESHTIHVFIPKILVRISDNMDILLHGLRSPAETTRYISQPCSSTFCET
jgi:hypothetical protein